MVGPKLRVKCLVRTRSTGSQRLNDLNYAGVNRILGVGVESRESKKDAIGESIFPCVIDVDETKVRVSN